MTKLLADSFWLDETRSCALEELAEISGLSIDEIEDLIDNGVIAPSTEQPRAFQLKTLVVVNTARRLRDDFQLDRSGLTLALTLLQRIAALEEEIEHRSASTATLR